MKDSMFILRQKLDALTVVYNQEFDWDQKDASKRWDARFNKQNELIDELRKLAIENNTLLGRQVKFQMADSYAVYIVTRIFKNQVQVTWLDWCDGWIDDRLGYQGNLDINYVRDRIEGEDKLRVLFS